MNKAFFKFLFDNNFEALRNYLYFRTGDKDLATDIAQECFLKLWEKQPSGDAATIKKLLYKIGHDLFISYYRHRNVEKNFIINQNNSNATSLSPEDILNYSELEKKYKKILKEMPENYRVVFLMSRTEELKNAEIANLLGLSVKAVEKRMSKALRLLKSALIENK
ncbi:RNA polymerase sigma factor [Geofilum sp. OHC36d9]|uniref:RNA polymerase sigma factor n=1 Tax=Geofilum sp. OHC36d9 TaxID=3458413 RepID=UPI004033D0A7